MIPSILQDSGDTPKKPPVDPVPWAELVQCTIDGDGVGGNGSGGDEDARERLALEASRRLQRWIRDPRIDLEDGEDVCQRVLAIMFEPGLEWLRGWGPKKGRKFPSYMFAKARFLAWDLAADKNHDSGRVSAEILDLLPSPTESFSQRERAIVWEEFARLSQDQKFAIWGQVCGYSSKELAARAGTTPTAVDIWRHRGLKALMEAVRKRLDDE